MKRQFQHRRVWAAFAVSADDFERFFTQSSRAFVHSFE
jgi:hypothetical protein